LIHREKLQMKLICYARF